MKRGTFSRGVELIVTTAVLVAAVAIPLAAAWLLRAESPRTGQGFRGVLPPSCVVRMEVRQPGDLLKRMVRQIPADLLGTDRAERRSDSLAHARRDAAERLLRLAKAHPYLLLSARLSGSAIAIGWRGPRPFDGVLAWRLSRLGRLAVEQAGVQAMQTHLRRATGRRHFVVEVRDRMLLCGRPDLVAAVDPGREAAPLPRQLSGPSPVCGVVGTVSLGTEEARVRSSVPKGGAFRLQPAGRVLMLRAVGGMATGVLPASFASVQSLIREAAGAPDQRSVAGPLPESAMARADLAVDIPALRKLVAACVWPEKGGPAAGTDDPTVVCAWDLLRHGMEPRATGRLALAVHPSPPVPEPNLLPVPEMRSAWETEGPAGQAFEAFTGEAQRFVDLFAAPGGILVWEAVRRQTVLHRSDEAGRPTAYTSLHPLFFHHAAPWWQADAKNRVIRAGTHRRGMGGRGLQLVAPGAVGDVSTALSGKTLLSVTARWNVPEKEADHWRALLIDKAIHHGWLVRPLRPAAGRGIAWLDYAGRVASSGQGRLEVAARVGAKRRTGAERRDPRICLDLIAAVDVDWRALAAGLRPVPMPEPMPIAEVAERQTR